MVENQSYSWSFKFSVEKNKTLLLLHTLYHTFVQVHRDVSKDPHTGRTFFAVTIPSLNVFVKRRTSDELSAYTVEMMAIVTVLQWTVDLEIKKIILCSDSSSALMS